VASGQSVDGLRSAAQRGNQAIKTALEAEVRARLTPAEAEELALDSPAGSAHYRAWVGPPAKYDLLGAIQFQALTNLGLRDYHHVCDVGCGTLRAGRLLIPYLLDGHYCGIEPNRDMLGHGFAAHFGSSAPDGEVMAKKRPRFHHGMDFDLASFGIEFDFILAQSILSHTGPRDTELFFQQCAKVMTASTIVLFTFVRGRENCVEEGWHYPRCVTYTDGWMADKAAQHGLAFSPTEWPPLNNYGGTVVSGQTPAILRTR
jgi:SAM-dependent methyltransferase